MSTSEAIATAISMCKKWAAGGKDVHPDTRAKAAAAIAEWERLKASAHAKRSGGTLDMSGAESILRAGHWKHEYIPLDFAAAESKFHGHVPKGWHPAGGGDHVEEPRAPRVGKHAAHANEIMDQAREFSARGRSRSRQHEKVGYHMGLAAGALKSGDKTAALHHLSMALGAAQVAGDVHARDVGYAHTVIQQHMDRLRPAHAKRSEAMTSGYDEDGLDSSWDGDYDLPDLTGLSVADFEDGTPDQGVSRAAPKLGSGARFKALKAKLAAKGIRDPGALAAHIGRKKYGRKKFTALAAKARKGGGMHRSELVRDVPLEDYHIVRVGDGDGTGRVVEAYMTVFGEPAEIHDWQGDYEEDIDRGAFNKRIADLERSRNGFAAAKVFYNHGMTIHGTPSERGSMPIAVCEGIRADTRGPVTRSRYLDTPMGNEVLEMWRSGAITAQSFTGAIIRSDPQLRRGQKYQPRIPGGPLPRVRRLELGLREYGPTPFPAYQGAELVGVRMSSVGGFAEEDADIDIDDVDEIGDEALSPDEEAAAGGPPELHPSRLNAHRLWHNRLDEACREAGIVLPERVVTR